ncbi:MAG: BON domain-containing protein [Betaproteobacteria bacterium]|nr:BON domain-containing protein [Betaproteobacteria bacterium]
MTRRRIAVALCAPLLAVWLGGCVEMAAVGVGAGVVSALDRRTTGAQVEDEGIELRAANRINERFGDRVHVSVTSYNRSVLLTGEAPDARARDDIEKIVTGLQNIRTVSNEIQIAGTSAYSTRAADATITGKVKAKFVDVNRFNPVHVKVVTEAGVVYLMGIVTEKEAADATQAARTTGGVRKVVKVFEYCKLSDEACRPRDQPAGGGSKAR